MQKSIITAIAVSLALYSCKKEVKEESSNPIEINTDILTKQTVDYTPTPDNSRNSIDWEGKYYGIIQCENCEEVTTELNLLKDNNTFVLRTTPKGKNETIEKGTFAWNKSGSAIVLNEIKNKPNQYKVGENKLFQLDKNGNIIESKLGTNYILTKK